MYSSALKVRVTWLVIKTMLFCWHQHEWGGMNLGDSEFLEHGGGGRVRRRYRSQLHEMFCLSVRAATVGNLHAFLSALQMKSVTGSETAQLVSVLIAKQLNCSKCWSEDHIPVASLWDVAVMAVCWKGDTLHWLDNWGVLYLLVHQKWRELGESVALWLCFSGSETWWGMA